MCSNYGDFEFVRIRKDSNRRIDCISQSPGVDLRGGRGAGNTERNTEKIN